MTPYYDRDGITIYHGDCREILPHLPKVDLVLTDPPWPLVAGAQSRNPLWGDLDVVALWRDAALVLRCDRLLVWLPCHADPRPWLNPVAMSFLRILCIRRAIPGYYGRVLQDLEIVYALGSWPQVRKGRKVIPGGMSITYRSHDRIKDHPAPRSLEASVFLAKWWSDDGDIILDPFMGSGTTLVAAKELHRRAIGIELEEKYCELAVNRLRQAVLPFPSENQERDRMMEDSIP